MFQHHTKTKGDIAVLCCAADLARKGFLVLWPCTEHAPFDLVAYREGRFIRVQVRYVCARRGRIQVTFTNSYGDASGSHKRRLDRRHVDLVCAYCPDTETCYYIKLVEKAESATLRIGKTANGQTARIRWAEKYTQVP